MQQTSETQKQQGPGIASYSPIADYAVIGNCHTAALISRNGSIDWFCPARFDAPAVFCRILDSKRGGYCLVQPVGDFQPKRRYLDDTAILETTFVRDGTTIKLTDLMPVVRLEPQSTKTAPDTGDRIVRIIDGIEGEADIVIHFKPTFNYAHDVPQFEAIQGLGLLAVSGGQFLGLRCSSAQMQQVDEHSWEAKIHIRQGDRHVLEVVHASDREGAMKALKADMGAHDLEETTKFWCNWAEECTYNSEFRSAVLRSAITLKLLTFDPTGAIVAAPTTSLPEEIGGARNWDYRFTWLRDSSFILYALLSIGYQEAASHFIDWLRRITYHHLKADPRLLYTIEGKHLAPEKELNYLDGYCGSRPVRINNAASEQRQIDIYGEVLITAYIHFHHQDDSSVFHSQVAPPSAETWDVLRALVDDAAREWTLPDNGIWEVRGGQQDFVYSKLMCWAAVDRGIKLAEEYTLPADLDRWKKVRQEIRQAIEQKGYNQKLGAFTQAFDSDVLDASVLAIPRIGFLPPTDPRVLSTLDRIEQDLTKDGLVYRYRAPDGLAGSEGAFLLVSFWLVQAEALAGRVDRAKQLFEHLLGFANDVGLYSEEIAPQSGAFLGNFPQGFTHLSLIGAAVDLALGEKHGAQTEAHTEGERVHKAHKAAKQG